MKGIKTSAEQIFWEAEELRDSIHVLYRLLRRSYDPDIANSGLTGPQMAAIEELTTEDGLSLKELSMRMSLAHSTVSGIVDRLERRDLVRRQPDQRDRRFNRIFLSEEVKEYVESMDPARRFGPIPTALGSVGEEEREQIVKGFRLLRGVLEKVVAERGEGQNPRS